MLALLPLLGKKIEELTLEDLNKVKTALKIDVNLTDELRDAGLALLKGDSIDKVSDLIQSPESIQKLLGFFKSQEKVPDEPPKQVLRCPHCSLFFI